MHNSFHSTSDSATDNNQQLHTCPALEKHLLDRFIHGKPFILSDIPQVVYRKDVYTAVTFAAVRKKVEPQVSRQKTNDKSKKRQTLLLFFPLFSSPLSPSSSHTDLTPFSHAAGDSSGAAHPGSSQGDPRRGGHCAGVPLLRRGEGRPAIERIR